MLKKLIQRVLQKGLGFDRYLFLFSLFIIHTIKWNKNEGDIRHFIKMLKVDDLVLDIGANIGIMSSLIARKCSSGTVIAFEPIPENVKALQRVLKHFNIKNVEIKAMALGETEKQIKMNMPIIQGVRMQGLSHASELEGVSYEGEKVIYEVQQSSLDLLFRNRPRKINAIKMDVENYEYQVLLGSSSVIAQDKPLIYTELWDNENRQKCIQLLEGFGYKTMVLEKGLLTAFNEEDHHHQNFFFISPK